MTNLTQEELTLLKELSTRKGIRGQRLLKNVVWLNTVESKFKVGDFVKFSNEIYSIKGNKVINFSGKITMIEYQLLNKSICYTIQSRVITLNENQNENDKIENYTSHVYEEDIKSLTSSDENFIYAVSDVKESIDL